MGLHLPQPFGSFTSTVMADEPPPPPPYGSADWYLEKTVALEKLTTVKPQVPVAVPYLRLRIPEPLFRPDARGFALLQPIRELRPRLHEF